MKKIALYSLIGLLSVLCQAQVLIGEKPQKRVDKNASLELFSNNKGLLLPRLNTREISQLQTKLSKGGYIVFNNETRELLGWNGQKWINLLGGVYTPVSPNSNDNASNYYSTLQNKNYQGAVLKTELSKIISANYIDNGYGQLYTTYSTTDIDNYYENDGTILDIYSERPQQLDSYNFTYAQSECGNYSKEGDCYNREHIVPQSLFGKRSPMRNDAHFVVPTDGKVNGVRGNLPFGIVKRVNFISSNGSKKGTDENGRTVFEPIDEFKGDVARMIFYFVTRYEKELPSFSSGGILNPSNPAIGIDAVELEILKQWHKKDPVSQRERDRNDALQRRQNNRNPFIDHPEWVSLIWGK